MIWTMKVVLWAAFSDEVDWEAQFQIDSSSELDVLHFAIQNYVKFDNDHSYEFYVARTERSRKKKRYSENEGSVFETKLEDLFPLEKSHSLFYMFDYGDQWIFKITKTRSKPFKPLPNTSYPRLLEETGHKPIQYHEIE